MEILPIQTARLVLRRFSTDDLVAFQQYRSDPELARYQGWSATTDSEARTFLAAQSRQVLGPVKEWLQVAVTLRQTGELIGDIALCVRDLEQRVVELGFTVSRPWQRQGCATEAVNGALAAVFAHHVRSVVAVTDSRNTASIALLERLDFALERTEQAVFKGETCDEQTFRLTAARRAGRSLRS